MESLRAANADHLLQSSMEELHKMSNDWLSELSFWKIELDFFQSLLEKNALKSIKQEDRANFEQIQNKLIYYRGELIDQYHHDIREHEKMLSHIKQNNEVEAEQTYRKEHRRFAEEIAIFDRNLKDLKKNLFRFIEELD